MRISRTLVGALALTVVLLSTAAFAQPLPHENHYKVYQSSGVPLVKDVALSDQFGKLTVTNLFLDHFSTPAEKIHNGITYPMVDPLIHLDWWRISPPSPQPPRTVIVTDQFGTASWTVTNAVYLLLPSLKNVPVPGPPVPTWNHYLCYDVQLGPFLNQPQIVVIDQFGTAQIRLRRAVYLCNPVEKTVFTATGPVTYPIVDPTAHLAVYELDSPSGGFPPVTALDQFGLWSLQLNRNDLFCVPALKDHPVPTESSTWGKIKSLYR